MHLRDGLLVWVIYLKSNLILVILLFNLLNTFELIIAETNFHTSSNANMVEQTTDYKWLVISVLILQCVNYLMVLSCLSHIDIFTNVTNIIIGIVNIIYIFMMQ